MLYRLSLTSLDSFKEIEEKEEITINYRPYSNFIDISSDREALTARNQRDILNITSLVNSINKIGELDLIWVNYENKYILTEIQSKVSLDQNNALIKLNCKNFISQNTPKVIREIFDDIKFALVDDDYIFNITLKILSILEMREEKKSCELKFVKGEGELVEISEKNYEITPYINKDKDLDKFITAIESVDEENSINSGEIILELNSSDESDEIKFSNLPVKIENNKEIESTKDFYIDIMEKQVDFYMNLQRKTMNNFLQMEEELWDKFFEMIK